MIVLVIVALNDVNGILNYLLHVTSLRANDPPRHLKLFLILNLDIVSACQFALFVVVAVVVGGIFLAVVILLVGRLVFVMSLPAN